jgi:hypothetical protein
MVASGIVLAFLSFFLTADHNITDGVLWYVAQALTFAGAVFGISVYIKSKVGEVKSEIIEEARRWMRGQSEEKRERMSERVTDEQIEEARKQATEYWDKMEKDKNAEDR